MPHYISQDLMNHIYEYEPTKRENLEKCFSDIHIKGTLSRVHQIDKCWQKHNENSFNSWIAFDDFLQYHIQDDYECILKNLSRCNCCSRHQLLKPSTIYCTDYYYYSQQPELSIGRKDTYSCSCSCRHESRKIRDIICPYYA
jgi:hypothetical protein